MTRPADSLFLTAPLGLRAASPGTKLPSRFTGVAYSGELVPSYGCVVDLDSTTVPAQMALLSEHERTNIIGLVESASKTDNRLIVAGSLYSDMAGSQAEKVGQLAQRGFNFQMSLGLYNFSEESVPQGLTARVNGRDIPGPVTVLRNGKVRECSIVTLGADHNTSAAFFGAATVREQAITSLFTALGRTPSQSARDAYMRMSARDFLVVTTELRRLALRARGMQESARTLDPERLYARRRELAAAGGLSEQAPASLPALDIYVRRRAEALGAH